jgi:hypothetical protein
MPSGAKETNRVIGIDSGGLPFRHVMARSKESHNMNVLLIYPRFPDTFRSFTYALSFIGKKAAFSPPGLLTVATLLPEEWPPSALWT